MEAREWAEDNLMMVNDTEDLLTVSTLSSVPGIIHTHTGYSSLYSCSFFNLLDASLWSTPVSQSVSQSVS